MASGVLATIPTMVGIVGALSGVFFVTLLNQKSLLKSTIWKTI